MELAIEPKVNAAAGSPIPMAVVPRSNPVQEYWDINGIPLQGAVSHNAAAADEFSDLGGSVAMSGGSAWKVVLRYLFLALLLGAGGYAAYLYFVEERNPIEEMMALLEQWQNHDEDFEAPVARKPKVKPQPLAPTSQQPQPKDGKFVNGNPYWHLPNAILGQQLPQGREWTAEEEETWRAGLVHRFSYQRWRTVQEVRQMRLKGSEQILWDALQDKKFWTRGYAAIALAELGTPIALQNLDAIMQGARSELIADFFERFTKRCNPGQCFVLRQVLRLVDTKGRLIALSGIANSKDQLRDLYLTAATLDPDKRVQRWIRQYFASHPIAPERFDMLLKMAQSENSADSLLTGVSMNHRSSDNGEFQGQAKTDTAPKFELQLEEAANQELERFDRSSGIVEFYETNPGPTPQPVGDSKVFEYTD